MLLKGKHRLLNRGLRQRGWSEASLRKVCKITGGKRRPKDAKHIKLRVAVMIKCQLSNAELTLWPYFVG